MFRTYILVQSSKLAEAAPDHIVAALDAVRRVAIAAVRPLVHESDLRNRLWRLRAQRLEHVDDVASGPLGDAAVGRHRGARVLHDDDWSGVSGRHTTINLREHSCRSGG